MDISTYFGTPEPKSTQFGQSSGLFQATPSAAEVTGAYVEETFQGEGSLVQDIEAMNIRRSETPGTAFSAPAISEDDWKSSVNYRPGLTYHPTMTEYSAKTLASIHDDRLNRQSVMDKASKLQSVVGFGAGFVSGVAEPKNLISGIAAALVTGGTGALVPSLERMIAVNTIKGAATRGAAEGVVGAALTEPSNIESSKVVQGDYTMTDSMINLALGSVLGAGLGAGGKALELRARGKELEKIRQERNIVQAYRAERDDLGVKEFDTAISQLTQGSEVDVRAVKQIDNVEVSARARQELPKIEEKITAIQAETGITKVTETPEFKGWFGNSKVVDESGVPRVVYHGTSADIKAFDPTQINATKIDGVEGFYFATDPNMANTYAAKFNKAGGNVLPVYAKIERPAPSLNEFKLDKSGEYDGFSDGKIVVVKDPGQVKSVFNRGKFDANDPRLIDLDNLEVKRGQAMVDSKRQSDAAPVTKLQDSVSKSDNSTAYNPKYSEEIQTYLDQHGLEDEAALEQSLQELTDEIAELRSQDLLTDGELGILERLSEIDAENNIFDNVLLSAKLCLTRG
jgi:hypothetical protein